MEKKQISCTLRVPWNVQSSYEQTQAELLSIQMWWRLFWDKRKILDTSTRCRLRSTKLQLPWLHGKLLCWLRKLQRHQLCSCCEMKYCNECSHVKTWSKCHTTSCEGCTEFGTCNYCDKTQCSQCISKYCINCYEYICEDCTSHVVRYQGSSCSRLSCIDCIGNGDVKRCALCEKGFCSKCRTMEHCSRVCGEVCLECHINNHDISECYWQLLPPELHTLVPDFAREGISIENLAQFWKECTQFIGRDKEFDFDRYKQIQRARVTSYILAVDFL